MTVILHSVFSLFIMILVGVYSSKRGIITYKLIQNLIDIIIQIALPSMIVASFIFTYDDNIKSNIIKTSFYSLVTYVLVIIISYFFLLPVKGDKKIILQFGNVFTNTGHVGFPILHAIYGPEGVIYGSIFNLFFVIFVWTYGILLFENNFKKEKFKEELMKILLNPSIIAVFVGTTVMVFDIQLPKALVSSMKSLGDIAGPLSMLIIGVILSNIKIKDYLKDWTIYYGIFIKLVVLPLLTCLLFLLKGDLSAVAITIIVMVAIPTATTTSIFAENYDVEPEYAAVLVSVTTLLSLVTVPILLKILLPL